MLMASAVAIPLLFIDGTRLSRGALPYLVGALLASAALFVASYVASRRSTKVAATATASTMATWLAERELEVRKLANQLDDVLARQHFEREKAESPFGTFLRVREDVCHKLQPSHPTLAARVDQLPAWFDPNGSIPIKHAGFREIPPFMRYVADRIAEAKDELAP